MNMLKQMPFGYILSLLRTIKIHLKEKIVFYGNFQEDEVIQNFPNTEKCSGNLPGSTQSLCAPRAVDFFLNKKLGWTKQVVIVRGEINRCCNMVCHSDRKTGFILKQ